MSDRLIEAARSMLPRAYAPYSKFRVGAAIETKGGKIFAGCNVENASYPLSVCAERNAVAAAVAAGQRKIVRVAIVASNGKPTPPCGACRQVLAEFADDAEVVLVGNRKTVRTTLAKLLPTPFRKGDASSDV